MAKERAKVISEKDEKKVETTPNEVSEKEQVESMFEGSLDKSNVATNDDPKVLEEQVESLRSVLHEKFKKSKRLSNIAMIVTVGLIVVAFILLLQKDNQAMKITGYVLCGVSLVGMLVFYSINKGKFPSATKDYINNITADFNAFTYHDECYKTLLANPEEKVDEGTIISDKVYSSVSQLASRNVVHTTYHDVQVMVADLAVYRNEKNKSLPVFVGKYISMPNNISFDGRVIIQIKKKLDDKTTKTVDNPSDVSDLAVVKDDDECYIAIDPNYDYKEVLGTKLISDLKAIKIENHLLNINVVVWGGHTAVYLSFDDELMVFPFENKFRSDACIQYEEVQKRVLEILDSLNEKRTIKKVAQPLKVLPHTYPNIPLVGEGEEKKEEKVEEAKVEEVKVEENTTPTEDVKPSESVEDNNDSKEEK